MRNYELEALDNKAEEWSTHPTLEEVIESLRFA
jgi:hypothetical protein